MWGTNLTGQNYKKLILERIIYMWYLFKVQILSLGKIKFTLGKIKWFKYLFSVAKKV